LYLKGLVGEELQNRLSGISTYFTYFNIDNYVSSHSRSSRDESRRERKRDDKYRRKEKDFKRDYHDDHRDEDHQNKEILLTTREIQHIKNNKLGIKTK